MQLKQRNTYVLPCHSLVAGMPITKEQLCFQLARRRIYANVIPATGPVSAGGDQGKDFETYRVGEVMPGTESSFFARVTRERLSSPALLKRTFSRRSNSIANRKTCFLSKRGIRHPTLSSANAGPALCCVPGLVPRVAADSSADSPESSTHDLRDSSPQTLSRSGAPPAGRSTEEFHSPAAPARGPGASRVVAAAAHLSVADDRHDRLSSVPTCRGCDSHASSELPFVEQRAVVGQSPIASDLARTTASLRSVVSLKHQNRVRPQQDFP